MSRPSGTRDLFGRSFAAVLFDLDGTLVDSTPVVLRSWARWAVEEGVDPARLRGFHGVPAASIVRAVLADTPSRWNEATDRIQRLELADTDGVVALPGAREALASLSGDSPDGRPWSAIATSCDRQLYAVRAAAAGIAAPRVTVTASDVEHGKPSPDPWLLAARLLGVAAEACLVVEDAPNGLRAAKAAGCGTLAVVTTTARDELVSTGLADAIVPGLADVRFEVTPNGIRVLAA